MSLPFCLPTFLYINLSTHPSVYLYFSIYLTWKHHSPSTPFLYVHFPIYLSIHSSFCLHISLYPSLSIYLCLSHLETAHSPMIPHMSTHFVIYYLSTHPPVYLCFYLFIYLPLSFTWKHYTHLRLH